MKVPNSWGASHEFACYTSSCRPPTSGGTGGSTRGGTGASGRGSNPPPAFQHMTDRQLTNSRNPAHRKELERRKSENKQVFLSADG